MHLLLLSLELGSRGVHNDLNQYVWAIGVLIFLHDGEQMVFERFQAWESPPWS